MEFEKGATLVLGNFEQIINSETFRCFWAFSHVGRRRDEMLIQRMSFSDIYSVCVLETVQCMLK